MIRYIYSAGGYARELARLVREQYPNDQLVFIDDSPTDNALKFEDAIKNSSPKDAQFLVAFASAELRKKKQELVTESGYALFSVQARTAIIGDNVSLGEGYVLSDFSMITADAIIGKGFQCNIYSYIAHDCVVGDYVTLAPRVSVNGRVSLENNVYIGTGATILPGKLGKPIVIGEGAIVGAHAMVTKSVAAGSTVVGCPAKPIS